MEFGLLGPLLVRDDEGPREIAAAKQRTVLASLLLNANTAVSVGELIRQVWEDRPPSRGGTGGLYNHVMRLRTAMGAEVSSRLVTRPPGYLLQVREGELDLQQFQSLRERGRAAARTERWEAAAGHLAEALALFRGEPLADVPSELLVSAHQQMFSEMRLQAMGWRIDADLRLGKHSDLIAELRQLAAEHPLREQFHAQLLIALHRDGRTAEALEAFRRLRDGLVGELGIEPTPELQRLHQQILRSDPTAGGSLARTSISIGDTPTVPAQLPTATADFAGRAEQINELVRLLGIDSDEEPLSVPMIAVSGPGGIGKSTLALHVANLLRDRFPDGQLFADLHGTGDAPLPPEDVLDRFLRDLGMDSKAIPGSLQEKAIAFRSLMADRRTLIVLDDAASAPQVRPLVPGGGGCAVLITSRFTLGSLEGCRALALRTFDATEAHTLFRQIIGPGRAAAEPDASDEVVDACAGLPLAIRVAGGRLAARPAWSIRQLADRLADEQRRLDELKVGDLAVRSSFEVSYSNLGEPEPGAVDPARAFRLLGATALPVIGLPAAAALFGAPCEQVEPTLEQLVDSYLLESPSAGRYRFHDLLRTYANERAVIEEAEQFRRSALRRLLTWYVGTATNADQRLVPHRRRAPVDPPADAPQPLAFGDRKSALDWCEQEIDALLVLVRLAVRLDEHAIASRLPTALWGFLALRHQWTVLLQTHDIALSSARRLGDDWTAAVALNNLGTAYANTGRPWRALDQLKQALAIRETIDDRWGQAASLNNLGMVHAQLADHANAVTHHELALKIFRSIQDKPGEAQALNNLGSAWRRRGEIDRSVGQHEAAIAVFKEIDDEWGIAQATDNLGVALMAQGRGEQAVARHERAAEMCDRVGHMWGKANALDNVGTAYRRMGEVESARSAWTKALEIFERLHAPEAEEVRERISADQ